MAIVVFSNLKIIITHLSSRERALLWCACALVVGAFITRSAIALDENSIFVPVRGGTYKEGVVGQPIALNPIISNNHLDEDLNALLYAPLSKLAERIEQDKTNKQFTVKLKEELAWSDGTPLTSDDIIFTIKAIQDPDANSPLIKLWQGVTMERVSELQVRFTLPTPYAFLSISLKRLQVIPRHIFGNIPVQNIKLSRYNTEPVSSGPYIVKAIARRKDGFVTSYHLIPNEKYVERPYIENFYMMFYPEAEELIKAWNVREINGWGTSSTLSAQNGTTQKAQFELFPLRRYYAIFLNQTVNPLLKDKNLREALAYALDRHTIKKALTSAPAETAHVPFLTRDAMPPYNPEKAAELLKKVKAPAEVIVLTLIVPRVAFLEETARIIKQAWTAIGVQTTIVPLEPEEILSSIFKSRNYETVLFGNIIDNEGDLFPFWHSSQRFYPGLNITLFQNTKVDAALEIARQAEEEQKRGEAYETAQDLLIKDTSAIFLFTLPYTYMHTKALSGITTTTISNPAERFANVEKWSVAQVRVLKK